MGTRDATGGVVAQSFACEGFTAFVSRRNSEELETLVSRICDEGGQVRVFVLDIRKEDQVQEMF